MKQKKKILKQVKNKSSISSGPKSFIPNPKKKNNISWAKHTTIVKRPQLEETVTFSELFSNNWNTQVKPEQKL